MSPAVFGRGHLRLYLLLLLDESPRHGYELMQALTDRFGGTYVPSAGTIYPRLAKLEEDGLVTKESDGRKTVYAITDAGRAELAARRGELEGIESEITDSVRHLADEVRRSVDDAMRSLKAELAASAGEARASRTAPRGSGGSGGPGPDDRRADGRLRLERADAVVNAFRNEVRSDLRRTAATGDLPESAVSALREGLDRVLSDVRRSLGG